MINKNYLALLHKIWLSHKKLHLISNDYIDIKCFYNKLSWNLLYTYGFSPKQIAFILAEFKKCTIDYIDLELRNRNVKLITFFDEEYPDNLKNINNPPFLLYVRGTISSKPKMSVVWTRKMSSYWKSVINNIIPDISKYFTIVSWWALWCDTEAHNITLLNNWITISVIWTWINIDYPKSNKKLYDDIVYRWWSIISIFPIWENWNPHNFPVRNEIVAWLSVWVLVVEAQIKSWTFITANLALDMWRDLFAVPWNIFSINSKWCNKLISNWFAKSIWNANDLLSEYNIWFNTEKKSKKINFTDDIEKWIYNILVIEQFTINELKNKLNIDIATLSFKLSMMEINNYIKKWFWWKYEVF